MLPRCRVDAKAARTGRLRRGTDDVEPAPIPHEAPTRTTSVRADGASATLWLDPRTSRPILGSGADLVATCAIGGE